MYFDAVAAVCAITMGQRIYNFMIDFLEDSLSFDSIFSEVLCGLIRCINFMKGFITLTMIAIEIEKRQFLS